MSSCANGQATTSTTQHNSANATKQMLTDGTSEARLLPTKSSAAVTGEAKSGSKVRRSFSPAMACDEMRIGTNTASSGTARTVGERALDEEPRRAHVQGQPGS